MKFVIMLPDKVKFRIKVNNQKGQLSIPTAMMHKEDIILMKKSNIKKQW